MFKVGDVVRTHLEDMGKIVSKAYTNPNDWNVEFEDIRGNKYREHYRISELTKVECEDCFGLLCMCGGVGLTCEGNCCSNLIHKI